MAPPESRTEADLATTLSVIVPVYNESRGIDAFFLAVEAALDIAGCTYEIICINDGSTDDTLASLERHHGRNPRIKIVSFSRNFGKEFALSAGLKYCRGAAVVPIDADLQDPPELIPAMLAKWREGFDIVHASRESRRADRPFKRATAALFYGIFDRLTEVKIPAGVGDFRLMDRRVVAVLRELPERNRFMKGLFSWVGFRQTSISFDRPSRHVGVTTWSAWRLWNFALDGITSFSTVPLRFSSYLGVALCLFAFIYAVVVVVRVTIVGIEQPGYASLMVTVLFFGGMQFIIIGIMGEYIGRIYQEVKRRPLFVVDKTIGVDQPGDE
jgi:glycosyltransferase involved in cell wall biosynthesis